MPAGDKINAAVSVASTSRRAYTPQGNGPLVHPGKDYVSVIQKPTAPAPQPTVPAPVQSSESKS
jgi:hypothetical protein